ncbi:MAG: sulfite oxidase-like oxidoreductase [Bryobacteraceae bacterium]
MDNDKPQPESIPHPDTAGDGVIVSADTRRPNRIPPGQSRTRKWPVLDANGTPSMSSDHWKLQVFGLVNQSRAWTWDEFLALPRVKVFADFHCVTRWSRLGNVWEGVSTRELVAQCGGVRDDARFVVAHGYDRGWTTNMPIQEFLAEDALIAIAHDGDPLTPDHGGPARLIVPRLYAWKSAKWLSALEMLPRDQSGFWERNGYHNNGDPWKEERFGWGA